MKAEIGDLQSFLFLPHKRISLTVCSNTKQQNKDLSMHTLTN